MLTPFETTAGALVELLAAIYPEIDNIHERQGGAVPSAYRVPVRWAPVSIER